ARAVKVYRPSASDPNWVAAPVKPPSVTVVAPPAVLTVAVKATAAPSVRASRKAAAGSDGRVTTVLKVTVRLVTRERWAAPSLTCTDCTRGAGGAAYRWA